MSDVHHALEHERKVLPREQVNLSHEVVHVGLPTDPDAPSPNLRIIRNHGEITAIEVTCTCGCTMSIVCNYDS